jgi:eukaryotic-like serine/threonine-protein kinase
MASDDFEAIWRGRHLDQLHAVMAFDETVTARTFASAAEAAPGSSFSPPPLPTISLDRGGPAGASEPAPEGASAPDLTVLGTLGEGGMGTVLLARQRSLAREVAVKVLKVTVGGGDAALALLREAVVMGGVEHPNIVPVHALGRDDLGHPVLVMKRIEGTSWKALLEDPSHAAWAPLLDAHGDRATAGLEVLMRVADAAHFAHSRGVVHRDIKPENIMIGAFGEVYLVDWGIAARIGHERPRDPAEEGAQGLRGTPAFMAPEMLDGAQVDARTDVYLLGATLHAALTGTSRHQGDSLFAVLWAAHQSRPVEYGPDVPPELAALCNEATHPDPARRPQSALEFRRRLTGYVRHRASVSLAAAATERLAALRELLGRADADDAPRAQRLGVECRFGFAQALEVWPDNAHAREALGQTLRLLFEHEVARENLDAARALAEELGDGAVGTEGPLAALAATLRVRREREAAAVREARETDLTHGVDARPRFIAFVLSGIALINVFVRVRSADRAGVSVRSLVALNVGMLALLVAGLLVVRRGMLVTRIARQVSAIAVLCVVATLVHRALALLAGETSVPAVVAADLVILAAIFGAGAATIQPWLGTLAAWTLACAVAATAAPGHALTWYSAGTAGVMLLILYFGWLRVRPARAPGDAGPGSPTPPQ